MNPKTEEFLYFLLWTCEMLSRPTFRNLTESFEGWAYRNGFLRQLHRLEKLQLVEKLSEPDGDRVHRLTAAGRLAAMAGRDPEACWKLRWDGRWRLILYDVPEERSSTRNKLRRYLLSRGFGYLQNSVWVTPHPVNEERSLLADGPVDVESLLLLEARPCAGESDDEIVSGAWDFVRINQAYKEHAQVLARRPHGRTDTEASAKTFHRWLGEERAAWNEAMARDPLLPAALLPQNYAGQRSWLNRQAVMAEAAEQMRAFKAP